MNENKNIGNMIHLVKGKIVDKNKWKNGKIDTIVNAANPTLKGSSQGVDGSIHRSVNRYLKNKGKKQETLSNLICRELGNPDSANKIQCARGQAVTTSGYGFCKWIIHAVGTHYDGPADKDGNPLKHGYCSSSCIGKLESCYFSVVNELKKHLDMKVVGIPIIGAGNYKFPFELAVEIAIASIGNALLEWKKQDEELFMMSELTEIKLFIYDPDEQKCSQDFEYAQSILQNYKKYFDKEKRVVFQSSWRAHFHYIKETLLYDKKRGYFAVAKNIRFFLMSVRILFLPILCIKDFFGKKDWEKRRLIVEIMSVGKAALPILLWLLLQIKCIAPYREALWRISFFFIIYCMADTVTYLLVLMLMADIQKASANLIRSIMMLFVNYIEIACDLAFLAYLYYKDRIPGFRFRQALSYGFFSQNIMQEAVTWTDYMFVYLDNVLKFFFLTLVFGYFFNHMRLRKFRS